MEVIYSLLKKLHNMSNENIVKYDIFCLWQCFMYVITVSWHWGLLCECLYLYITSRLYSPCAIFKTHIIWPHFDIFKSYIKIKYTHLCNAKDHCMVFMIVFKKYDKQKFWLYAVFPRVSWYTMLQTQLIEGWYLKMREI